MAPWYTWSGWIVGGVVTIAVAMASCGCAAYLRTRSRTEREIAHLEDDIQRLEPAIKALIADSRDKNNAPAADYVSERFAKATSRFESGLSKQITERERLALYAAYKEELAAFMGVLKPPEPEPFISAVLREQVRGVVDAGGADHRYELPELKLTASPWGI